jgi:creatinine amidohydrolase
MLLAKMTYEQVDAAMADGKTVILPVGSTEVHGAHLPVDIDINIPYNIAQLAAERTGDLVAPPINYGYNERESREFAGTYSARTFSFYNYVFDICSSFSRSGFRRVFVLNGHGGNTTLIQHMMRDLEAVDATVACATWWELAKDTLMAVRDTPHGGMNHACEMETSAALYLDPEHVDMSRAVKDMSMEDWYQTDLTRVDSVAGRGPVYMLLPFRRYTQVGVMGDPTVATRDKGHAMINASVDHLAEFLTLFREPRWDKRPRGD